MKFPDPSVALRAELLLLRLFAVAPLFFLAVSLIIDFAYRGYFLESISAYYGSPVRDVFVGSLVAVGVVYVIYRGSTDVEDRALDLAGFFVVIVALIPHNYQQLLTQVNQPVVARATLFWIVIAWIVISVIFYWLQFRWRKRLAAPPPKQSRLVELLSCLVWGGFVAFAVIWMLSGQPFDTIHFVAAVLVVLCLIVVVAMHAFGYDHDWAKRRRPPILRVVYTVIAVWMFAGVILGVVLYAFGNRSWIFVTEIVEIGAFVAFWVVNLAVARLVLIKDLRPSRGRPEVTAQAGQYRGVL